MTQLAPAPDVSIDRRSSLLILIGVFVAAICGLLYELIAGTLSSYLLGDSVTQFSVIIGVFLTAMGVGSTLSRFIRKRLVFSFVLIEIVIGVVGGTIGLVGFLTFAFTNLYVPVLLSLVFTVGLLVGLEIPLVLRILREFRSLRVNVANVLSADYVGALAASLLFPFVLLPHVGIVRAGLLAGLANVLVAAILWRGLGRGLVHGRRLLPALIVLSIALLGGGAVWAGTLVSFFEARIYQDEIIHTQDSSYQRIIVTRWRDDTRLYLDGHLQFSSVDEYRYHEALAHPALATAERRQRVLILGGGDGLLAREVLRDPDVEHIDLVDIDPAVTELFRNTPILARLNDGSLESPRVHVHHEDAFRFLERVDSRYDVILIDLPDPSRDTLAKLYSRAFYRLARRHLTAGGVLATQATSPFRSREAFWCITKTLGSTKLGPEEVSDPWHVMPYHTVVPTFGTWGFVLATDRPVVASEIELRVPTRYLNQELLPGLFDFPTDMQSVDTKVNELTDPVLIEYYRAGYHRYLE